MGLLALTFFSVGATLGTGIFVILGEAVPKAGPAVVLSFVLAAVTALFSALSYAELAGTIPVSGSSYSYAYATLGEGIAWVCGWCLLLEYGVSISAVAVGWGQYVNEFLDATFGVTMPDVISQPPGDGGTFNIPAVVIVMAATLLLIRGVSESATANTIMVFIKLLTLVFFCCVAFRRSRTATCRRSRRSGSPGSARGRRRCSSPTSASTRRRRPARRPRTRAATCRSRS